MASRLTTRPEGVVFNALSGEVFDILARYTAFPWPVLASQSRRCDLDPSQLTREGLAVLAPYLSTGVGRFTSPEKEQHVAEELAELMRRT